VIDERAISARFRYLAPHLDEHVLRLWAAAEAIAAGYGGIAAVARATGMAASRIRRGRRELLSGETLERGRVRRPGAGRKPLVETDPKVLEDLEGLVDGDTRGDPESPLRWTSKSQRKLADGLRALGHRIGARSVAPLLATLGFSLQANRKVREGSQHSDRDAQFRYINEITGRQLAVGEPVISIDTKKKELVGDFKNGGREWWRKGQPAPVRVHDFKDKQLGKAIPHGVYDLGADHGWITVGIDHDTSQFRRELDPPLVAHARIGALSGRDHADDHRRLRGLQRKPHPAVEGGVAEAGR
jgi:Rhodopirellula transposase DDE domain